ncbi:MAG: NADH-quinone oxidoreductase subunit L [Planctomycetota bacterium]
MQDLLWAIPLLPLLGAVVCGLLHARGGGARRLAGPVATLAVGASFVLSVLAFLEVRSGHEALRQLGGDWIAVDTLRVGFDLTLDRLSGFMMLIVAGVGFLIHVYSIGYMAHDEGKARFFAYLNLFVFSMSVLVLGGSFALLFVGWEGVGLMSYLLIGFWYDRDDGWPAKAGQKAFVANRVGDFGFLLGMFLLFGHFGTLDYAGILESDAMGTWTGGLAMGAALLLFLGATGKSAQIPLFVWLPDAMAGPTPVSALIHAATMVTAGVYMVCRASFLFPPEALLVVAWIGGITAFVAATMALFQRELKKVLAYSTVSQLGYMFLACGCGAFSAAIFHVGTHAFFKALLFLGAGSVIHGMHEENDAFKMGGLRRHMPWTHLTFLVGSLCLAGFPLTSGFFSKDEILWKTVEAGSPAAWALWTLGAATAALTAFYTFRLYSLIFLGGERFDAAHVHPHESPRLMTVPLALLAALSLVGGLMGLPAWLVHEGGWMHHWLEPVVMQVQPLHAAGYEPVDHHAELWFALASGAIAVVGILLGVAAYRRGPALDGRLERSRLTGPAYQLFFGKWFVDEIYELFILAPLALLSRLCAWFDLAVVDGLVNRVGQGFRELGRVNRRVQDGRLQSYALWMAGGTAVLLAWLVIQIM